MKFNPIKFLWGKEDVKKILMFVIMLLIGCFIVNNFLLVKIKIIKEWEYSYLGGRRQDSILVSIDGPIDTNTSIIGKIDTDTSINGSVDTNTSIIGKIDTDTSINGKINADVSGDITAHEPIGGFDVNIKQ